MLKTIRSEIESLGWIIRTLAIASVAGALYRELRLPPEERTWHGRLLGFVPYDFRVPTPAKMVTAWWNPKSDQVIGDSPFGVGWSLNLAAFTGRFSESSDSSGSERASGRGKRRSRD
jgi:hypothetical protein